MIFLKPHPFSAESDGVGFRVHDLLEGVAQIFKLRVLPEILQDAASSVSVDILYDITMVDRYMI